MPAEWEIPEGQKTFERRDVTACFSQARSNAVFQLCGNGEYISLSSTHCICCVQRAKGRSRQQNPLGFLQEQLLAVLCR